MSAIAQLIYKQQRRGALAWGSVFGLYVWVSAYGYAAAYPTAKDRLEMVKSLGSNKGIAAIFGPARALDTVNGFTAWRCSTSFAAIGAIWGLLLATKVLRGAEDNGHAELLFAGPVTRRSGLIGQLAGIGIVIGVLFATVASWFVSVGLMGHYFSVTAGLWFSVVACSCAALFACVGAVTSQLASSRRLASAIAGSLFGAALLIRAIAGAVDGLSWLAWTSPLGWLDHTHPLTGTNVAPIALVALVIVVALGLSVAFADRRDLGAGVLRDADVAAAKPALLRTPLLLAVRVTRGVTIGWIVGVGIAAGVFGVVSSAVAEGFGENKSVADIFSRLGADISARGYVGVTFVMMGALFGFTAATFISACREEESTGRLEVLSAAPLRRWKWLLGRVAVGSGALVALGVAAGLGGWLGVAASGGHISFGRMMIAGINVVPPGLVVLGVGIAAYGLAPRSGTAVAYALVAWSFMLEFVGALVKLNHFVLDTSIIHHVAAAPAVDPRWQPTIVMLAVAVVGAVVGAAALERRDIAQG